MTAATGKVEQFGPAWVARPVVIVNGQHDTRIETGDDYDSSTLGALFLLEPGDKDKLDGRAFIPSSHCDYDARNHARQREVGSFVALTGDVDSGNHPLRDIESLVRGLCRDAAWLIYSSAHARPGDMRWRIIIPLESSLPFDEWHDAQNAFFRFMERAGVEMDRAMDRAGQLVFLPNVPAFHKKSGDPLRGEDGAPLYYTRATTGCNAPGLSLDKGVIASGIAEIRRQRAEDERERERIRKEADERRANRPKTEGAPIIEDFNRENPIPRLLKLYGYQQSPRHGEDWRSPHQTSESYATRVMGDKWVSLSASDVGARLGENFKGGCFGDAYDLFVHFEHSGDHKAAFRTLYSERRAATMPSYSPPPQDPEDPGWTEEVAVFEDGDAVMEVPVEVDPDLLPFFDAGDFDGREVTEREWMLDGWEPRRSCVYLTGMGAVGKSLFTQQRMTCAAVGRDFLGIAIRPGVSVYITCEDDLDEMHRRQDAINAALGITWADLRGRLYLISLKGMLNKELCVFDAEDRMQVTDRWHSLNATIDHLKAEHVALDNVAHFFTGNENIRNQVAAFVGLIDGMAERINGVVLLLGHPNKAGGEYSGSTAWENQVRARLFLNLDKTPDGEVRDPDARVLTNSKPNYSKRGAELRFRWHKWAFILEQDMAPEYAAEMAESIKASAENEAFLRCLRSRALHAGREVGPRPGPSYAPARFVEMKEARGFDKKAMTRAMERLLGLGAIVTEEHFNPKSRRYAIVLKEAE